MPLVATSDGSDRRDAPLVRPATTRPDGIATASNRGTPSARPLPDPDGWLRAVVERAVGLTGCVAGAGRDTTRRAHASPHIAGGIRWRRCYVRGVIARTSATALIALWFTACDPSTAGPDDPAHVCSEVTWSAPAGCTATDIEGKLRCIPGLEVTPRLDVTVPAGYQRFDLVLTQPIDHDHPEAGTFGQHATLFHISDTAPVVLTTSGYGLSTSPGRIEITRLFAANQISYEHRFFGPSRPDPADWSKLDIRQAALDAHGLAEALHWLYPNRWVNTGASKGGMTSVYQRRFHPCDVDATVAYVAPTSLGTTDPSYVAFLDQAGGADWAACRADLAAFQRRLLEARADIIPLVQGTFTQIGVEEAFEIAVIEVNFAFWQYTRPTDPGAGCSAIPGVAATPEQMLAFMELHAPVDGISGDAALDYYHAYYHQSAAQLGGPAPYETPVADLLQFPGADVPETYIPAGEVQTFDTAAMPDVNAWVANDAQKMMFIYGEFDPWSSRKFVPSANDSHLFVVPGGNHGSSIGQLSASDHAAAQALLEGWLDTPAIVTTMHQAAVATVPAEDRDNRRWPR